MTAINFDYEFEFDNVKRNWTYSPRNNDIKTALVEIIIDKFNIKDDAGCDTIEKMCFQDDGLAYRLAMYYEEELTEYFKNDAKNDFEEYYEPEEPDEWDEVDIYLDMKAVGDL